MEKSEKVEATIATIEGFGPRDTCLTIKNQAEKMNNEMETTVFDVGLYRGYAKYKSQKWLEEIPGYHYCTSIF